MHIEQIRYFLEVIRYGSINKASQALHMKQQNLSRTIKAIEQELSMVIFERTSKGIRLTQDGEEVARVLEQMLTLYDGLLKIPQQTSQLDNPLLQTGELKYYSMADIWANTITNILDSFCVEYPNITVAVEETSTDQLMTLLKTEENCVGKVLLIDNGQEKNIIPQENLIFFKTYPLQPVVYCDPNSTFAKTYKSTSLKSLLKQQLVVYKPFASGKTLTEEFFAGIGTPNIRYVVSNSQAFYNVLHRKDCITIGCQGPFNTPSQNDIAMIPIRDAMEIQSHFVIHQKSKDNPLINIFLDFQMACIKAKLQTTRTFTGVMR